MVLLPRRDYQDFLGTRPYATPPPQLKPSLCSTYPLAAWSHWRSACWWRPAWPPARRRTPPWCRCACTACRAPEGKGTRAGGLGLHKLGSIPSSHTSGLHLERDTYKFWPHNALQTLVRNLISRKHCVWIQFCGHKETWNTLKTLWKAHIVLILGRGWLLVLHLTLTPSHPSSLLDFGMGMLTCRNCPFLIP